MFVDYDSKEFDIYSFQMAVFSVVVAIALLGTSLQGLGTFEISENLLILLGISQSVFLVGRAAGTSSFEELDAQLDKVIEMERRPSKTPDEVKILNDEIKRAADMFVAAYGTELGAITVPLWDDSVLARQEVASGTAAVFAPDDMAQGNVSASANPATNAPGPTAGTTSAGAGGAAGAGTTGGTGPVG